MCGIVGYIGTKKAKEILINGLIRLEYRGYDSAGVATMEEDGIRVVKRKGRVNELATANGIENLVGTIGIAHTRWATHGIPSEVNSHPHMDKDKTVAVVHNGIIENYAELRQMLESKGYTFLSQTDTEVIPNLINYFYEQTAKNTKEDLLLAVKETIKMLNGSFAIEVLHNDFKDMMIVLRKDSPLVIGKGEEESYISSDIPAILSFTKDFYLLNDMEIAVLTRNEIEFFDVDLNKIDKPVNNIAWNMSSAEKDGFEDFMLKEIYEQPKSIRETIGARLPKGEKVQIEELDFTKEYLESLNRIYIIACGTAMHAGMTAKKIIEDFCKIQTEVDAASEFRYRNPLIDEKTLCIFISQSGETADTIAALKLAKEHGAKTVAISNVIGSSIVRAADYSLYTHAGPEIAVASTKAYTAQIVLLSILGMYFAEVMERNLDEVKKLKEDIYLIPSKLEEILKNISTIKKSAKEMFNEKDVYFIGRGIDKTVALEASLKLKEISYIHSDAYPAGELKHGPIALIEKGTVVIGIMTDELLVPKTVSNLQEVVSRGAKTLIVTNQDFDRNLFDIIIEIPKISEYISPVLSVVPLQLLAYYISKEKGLDVDKPRNLAKSVTVE